MQFVAYVGWNGIDFWDVITGTDETKVRKDAENSADRCRRRENREPSIEIISSDW